MPDKANEKPVVNAGCGHPSTNGRTDGYCSTSGCNNHYEKRHQGQNGP